MKWLPVGLVVGLLTASSTLAADAKKVVIRWHGQSFFEIVSSQGTRIVIDPHNIPEYGRQSVKADLVLTSHLHNDHTQVDVVENLRQAKRIDGVVGSDNVKGRWNVVQDEKFKDITLNSLSLYHDEQEGLLRGKNTAWIIDVDGLRIVHLGDLGHFLRKGDLKRLGTVDVLMIPVGGVYTINGADAKRVVEEIKPLRYILPMHYATPVYDALLGADEFLEDQKKTNVEKLKTNQLAIDPTAKPPAEPIIVMLGWTSEKP
jgi:L-ascorbate metabolism protein UlaG (beta-lactamase superfamily)